MVTLYNVISEDGYIATKDGSEHFIPDALWPTTLKLIGKYDVLVMGRKTYEAIQQYPPELLEPFEKLPIKKVVVTTNMDFHPCFGYMVSHSPQDTLAFGKNVLVSSGLTLNDAFLKCRLADKVIFHKIPIKIDEGMRPFEVGFEKTLILESETELDGGIKELTYRISNSNGISRKQSHPHHLSER